MDDAWWRVPGAAVEGHRGAVRVSARGGQASCACGGPFPEQPSVQGACLALLLHQQAAVRDGARVVRREDGDDDGTAGVREPRVPGPSSGSGAVGLDLA